MRNKKIEENKNVINAVKCELCEMKSQDLTSHITRMHFSIDEYKEKFPNSPIRSESYLNAQSERIKGDKNPAYQHGGKYSPFSEKFIHGKDAKIHERISKKRDESQNTNTKAEFYIKRGFSQEDAQKELSKRQSTFSLEKCVKKFGQEKGTEIWKARQEKWLKNYPKGNFSKISQKIFWQIFDRLSEEQRKKCKFATLSPDGTKDESGKNYEQVIQNFRVDFTLDKKVIEFDGDYWHGDKNAFVAKNTNISRDKIRDEQLSKLGYLIYRVREHQYKQNPQKVIDECLCFLKK